MKISDDLNRFVQNIDVMVADMDGEIVMLSVERGDYFSVSGIGPYIWRLIEIPKTLDELVDAVCAKYEIDIDTAYIDIRNFIQDLAANGIVKAL